MKKCTHPNFEAMCQARQDIDFDDEKRRYNKDGHPEVYYNDEWITVKKLHELWGGDSDMEWKCSDCGKTGSDMYDDVNDINPNRRVSQQPHGSSTLYCNMCQGYVIPTSFGGQNDICPYHQRSYQSEEGTVMMYDEFDQNGEAW